MSRGRRGCATRFGRGQRGGNNNHTTTPPTTDNATAGGVIHTITAEPLRLTPPTTPPQSLRGHGRGEQHMPGGSDGSDYGILLSRLNSFEDTLKRHDVEMKTLMNRYDAEIEELMEELQVVSGKLQVVEKENLQLKYRVTTLEFDLGVANDAILGDRVSLNKIRCRILLDKARDRLATLCGFNNWRMWREAMMDEGISVKNIEEKVLSRARVALCDKHTPLSQDWRLVERDDDTLELLVRGGHIRHDGNSPAHDLTDHPMAGMSDSIFALQADGDRDRMIFIYRIVFGTEPVFIA